MYNLLSARLSELAIALTLLSSSLSTLVPANNITLEYKPFIGIVSAYTSDPLETDDTPFITASGQTVRDGIVANNCLPFGSKILINNKIFEVQDRMNRRYSCANFDLWYADKASALQFGRQELEITFIGNYLVSDIIDK